MGAAQWTYTKVKAGVETYDAYREAVEDLTEEAESLWVDFRDALPPWWVAVGRD